MEEKKRLQPTEGGRCVECMHPAASGEPPTEALVDAIPVADILQRLLALPTEKAWEVFGGLDRLLKNITIPHYEELAKTIGAALEEKEREAARQEWEYRQQVGQMAARPTMETKIDNFYNQGGTFNDQSGAMFMPYALSDLKQTK